MNYLTLCVRPLHSPACLQTTGIGFGDLTNKHTAQAAEGLIHCGYFYAQVVSSMGSLGGETERSAGRVCVPVRQPRPVLPTSFGDGEGGSFYELETHTWKPLPKVRPHQWNRLAKPSIQPIAFLVLHQANTLRLAQFFTQLKNFPPQDKLFISLLGSVNICAVTLPTNTKANKSYSSKLSIAFMPLIALKRGDV